MSSIKRKTKQPYRVEKYLDNLPADTTTIDLSRRQLALVPSLSRFTQLKTLNLSNNPLLELPPLPPFLENLNVRGTLLSRLPQLPSTLEQIVADHCRIISVPRLPSSVIRVDFSYNPLWHMVNSPSELTYPFGILRWVLKDTPLFDIIYNPLKDSTPFELDAIGEKGDVYKCLHRLKILNRFRDMFYALKYKRRFRHWLWVRVRLPKIERHNHPDLLRRVLDDSDEFGDLDTVMETFGVCGWGRDDVTRRAECK
jgi:hypothetical protein